MLKILRPVGDPIDIITSEPNQSLFLPYLSKGYASGTTALAACILSSIKLRPEIENPEVLVPAYGCPDLISAVTFAGATPVLIDLEDDSPYMSLAKINAAINQNTIAIIAVRFFGVPERWNELRQVTVRHNIVLIEDSAQGFPRNNPADYWSGDLIILSFGRGKPVNLLGGGAVLSQLPQSIDELPTPEANHESYLDTLKQKIKIMIYNVSIHPIIYGVISKIPGMQIGKTIYKPLNQLSGMSKYSESLLQANINRFQKRKNIQREYRSFFESIASESVIDLAAHHNHDYAQPLLRYPILMENKTMRDALHEKLKPYGSSVMYEKPLHLINPVDQLIKKPDSEFENAVQFAERLITLPTHTGVSSKVFIKIQEVIKSTIR